MSPSRQPAGGLAMWPVCCIMLSCVPLHTGGPPAEPDHRLKILVEGPKQAVKQGEEITLSVTVLTESDQVHTFQLGDPVQVLGIYVLGPWGFVQPDPERVRPENWMHQGHFSSRPITVTKNAPWKFTFKLSAYYRVADPKEFRPGEYQLNIKFYSTYLKMETPITSEPIRFTILPSTHR